MKKQFLSFVMMLVLVIMASSAFALNDKTVYQGGTYHYKLTGVSSTIDATATVTFADPNVVIDQPTFTITGGAGPTILSFDITYVKDAVYPATGLNKSITVTVKGNASGSCSNYIVLNVEIKAAPTVTIILASSNTDGCQAINSSIPTDGTADAYADGTNTVTFDVTAPSLPTGATISYTLAVTSGVTLSTNPSGAKTATGSFDAIFLTKEGPGFTIGGTISTGATFTMPLVDGGATYPLTISGTPTITYKTLPTIGSFE